MEMDTSIPGGAGFRIDTSVSSRGFTVDNLPKGGGVAYLDPDITGEGARVEIGDGFGIFNPPSSKPFIPDWSEYKSLKKYFNRTDHQYFPTWLYHPTEEPVVAKNAKDAWEKFGVRLKESSEHEQAMFGAPKYRWDFAEGSWRPTPYSQNPPNKFDPLKPAQGKTYIPTAPNPLIAQNELLRDLVPLVTEAVAGALRGNGGPAAPSHIDPVQWNEFLQFQAWKKSSEAVGVLSSTSHPDVAFASPPTDVSFTKSALADEERMAWEAKAKEAGIKIDGRWSLPKLRDHVVSELQKRVQEAEGRTVATNDVLIPEDELSDEERRRRGLQPLSAV